MSLKKDKRTKSLKVLLLGFAVIIVVNILSSFWFARFDFTSEKRYSLSAFTEDFLQQLQGNVTVRVYLDGPDLPVAYKRMRNEIADKLYEFKVYGGDKISYSFINPSENQDKQVRFGIYKQLSEKGLHPTEIQIGNQSKSEKIMIFPCAVVCYSASVPILNTGRDTLIVREIGIDLLQSDPGDVSDDQLKVINSLETLEYELVNAIYRLSQINKPEIAFVEGHGETGDRNLIDISTALSDYYNVRRGSINGKPGVLDRFAAVIINKPVKSFSEDDKFVIDQYIMNGGNVLWLIDATTADSDSLMNAPVSAVMPLDINLSDMLFNYGARINCDIIKDLYCGPIGLASGGDNPQIKPYPWNYYPVIHGLDNNPITKRLDYLICKYVSSIDTVGTSPDVSRKVILTSSNNTKSMTVPFALSFQDINLQPDQSQYVSGKKNIAVLLEGKFESLYKGRHMSRFAESGFIQKDESQHSAQIIVSDGDVAINEVSGRGEAYPLGFDRTVQNTYKGNKQFIINAVNYLTGNNELTDIRMRQMKVRLLNKEKTANERNYMSLINTVLPLLPFAIFAVVFYFVRRRKYARKND